jgi:WD40 repeat protein/predicted Ser/Thr protein kinase
MDNNAQPPLTNFGRYQLVRELGHGGMGVVYQAYDPQLQRHVALKIISQAASGEKERKRFAREANLMARLNHPNIVKIFDIGEEQGRHFIAMELLHGQGLDKLLAENMPLTQLVRMLVVVATVVHYAHKQGIIHRDLKPSNIMVNSDYEPTVMDFGLAKEVNKSGEGLSKSVDILGTPEYMSPEQAQGSVRHIDAQSDVYSLGIILYEMITGKTPFHAANPMAILYQIGFDEPKPPSRLVPHLAKDLEAVCLKAIEKEKAKRYASADAFAEDLSRYLEGKPVKAKPVTPLIRLGKWMRRHRVATVAIMAAILLMLSGVLFLMYWQEAMRQDALKEAIGKKELAETLLKKAEEQQRIAKMQTQQAILNLVEAELLLAKNEIVSQDYFQAYTRWQKADSLLQETAKAGMPGYPLNITSRQKFLEKIARQFALYLILPNPHRTTYLSLGENFQDLDENQKSEEKPSLGGKHEVKTEQLQDLSNLLARVQTSQHVALTLPPKPFIYAAPTSPSWDFLLYWREERLAQAVVWDIAQKKEMVTLPVRYTSPIAIAFSGKRVALGDELGNIIVHDMEAGQQYRAKIESEVQKPDTDDTVVRCLRFSPNGQWLFSSIREKCVLWKMPEMNPLLVRPLGGVRSMCAFSQNGKWLAVGGTGDIYAYGAYVFSLEDLTKKAKVFPGHAAALCFGTEDKSLITGDRYDIRIYPLEDSKVASSSIILGAHQGEIQDIAMSQDGNFLASLGRDGKLSIWSTSNYIRIARFSVIGDSTNASLLFHPNKTQVAVWTNTVFNTYTWHIALHKQINPLLIKTNRPNDPAEELFKQIRRTDFARNLGTSSVILALSPRADIAASQLAWPCYLWNISHDRLSYLASVRDECKNISFSRDGSLLLGSWENQIMIWEVATQNLLLKQNVSSELGHWACWQPQSDLLMTVAQKSGENVLKFWQIRDRQLSLHHEIKVPKCFYMGHTMGHTFDPSGHKLVIDQTINLRILQLHDSECSDITTLDMSWLPIVRKTILFSTANHLAVGNQAGDFMIYDWQKTGNDRKPELHINLCDRIRRIWYDPAQELYWILTSNRLLLYPHVIDPALQEIAARIYPLPVFANYPLLACDISQDFRYVGMMLLSGEMVMLRLPGTAQLGDNLDKTGK